MNINRTFSDYQNDILFNSIKKSGGNMLSNGLLVNGTMTNVINGRNVINAIQIDWNGAQVFNETINTTGQLLYILQNLINDVNNKADLALSGEGNNNPKIIVLDNEEYEALNEYEHNVLYFVIGGEVPQPEPEEPTEFTTDLYINNTHYTTDNETISLIPGGNYTITGTLKGKIVIDATQANTANLEYTKITLNGVQIESDDAYAIMYEIPDSGQGYKGISVTIEKNTFNSLNCTKQEEGENQPGAIYSMNNLEMQGAGYLAIQNSAGHGIRGQEVKLANIHLWADTSHDGVHGKNITIIGGTYYFNNCNDCFGTSSKGKILYFDGEIRYNHYEHEILDGKNFGLYFNESLLSVEELTHCSNMNLLSKNNFNRYVGRIDDQGVEVVEGFSNGKVIGYDSQENYANGTDPHEIIISNSQYNVIYPFTVITGYIEYPLFFDDQYFDTNTNAQIYLRNAYLTNSTNINTIYYEAKKGRLKIKAENDTINIIENTYYNQSYNMEYASSYDSDAIKSENNISIEVNNGSLLYITSKGSDGIDGTEIKITDSKGILIVANCGQRGIKGNAIVIGPSAVVTDSIITSYITATDNENYSTFNGICYVKNNCRYFNVGEPVMGTSSDDPIRKNTGFADIYCRNGKATKGVFGTTNNELVGFLITDSIGYVVQGDFGDAQHFYYCNNISKNTNGKTLQNDPGESDETYFAKSINNTNISY